MRNSQFTDEEKKDAADYVKWFNSGQAFDKFTGAFIWIAARKSLREKISSEINLRENE